MIKNSNNSKFHRMPQFHMEIHLVALNMIVIYIFNKEQMANLSIIITNVT